nr:MAG TPA: hypothetical protein [Crassvirales sp.]DAR58548.1 MAG TPA: hypothetical protein [Crassvirales sp.]
MICICFTIVIISIILLLGFYLYLTKYNPTKIQIDDRVYKDRLLILKDKYKEIKVIYDEEDEDIPISIKQLITLIGAITDRMY